MSLLASTVGPAIISRKDARSSISIFRRKAPINDGGPDRSRAASHRLSPPIADCGRRALRIFVRTPRNSRRAEACETCSTFLLWLECGGPGALIIVLMSAFDRTEILA